MEFGFGFKTFIRRLKCGQEFPVGSSGWRRYLQFNGRVSAGGEGDCADFGLDRPAGLGGNLNLTFHRTRL